MSIPYKTLRDVNLSNKHVILRVDYNVPTNSDGTISSKKRILASIPTIKYILDQDASIIILSHLGRVEKIEDITSNKKSLIIVLEEVKKQLPGVVVKFVKESVGILVDTAIKELKPREILILENTRYNDFDIKSNTLTKKDSKNDLSLGSYWASLGDVFVNDAFGVAHRAAASNVGIAQSIGESCLGFLVQTELENLEKVTNKPERPLVAILGGSKVSDKLAIIENLLKVADNILICGGMANTFLAANGVNMGNSLIEKDLLDTAKKILASDENKKIVLPIDFNCATEFKDVEAIYKEAGEDMVNLMALDIGKKTVDNFSTILSQAKTVFWNGPAGVFEMNNFQFGTKSICKILKQIKNNAFTIIGGGDSASAIKALDFKESDYGFISTGGGASLELIEGKKLPGIVCIAKK